MFRYPTSVYIRNIKAVFVTLGKFVEKNAIVKSFVQVQMAKVREFFVN